MHLESVNLPQQGSFFGWGLTCEVNLMEKNDGMWNVTFAQVIRDSRVPC